MSEPKLCPYRQHYGWTEDVQTKSGAYQMNGFDPCLQDKCAMWRTVLDYLTARHIQKTPSHTDYTIDVVGYCGLAGKP